jgi:hypothetical protein
MLGRYLFRVAGFAHPTRLSSVQLRSESRVSRPDEGGSTSSSSPSLQRYFPLSPNLRIFLIRHGQSQGNIDEELFSKIADHAIPLSDAGHNQAISAGHELRRCGAADPRYLEAEVWRGPSPPPDWRCGVWASPYYRVRQTRGERQLSPDHIIHAVGPHLTFSREHVALSEQQVPCLLTPVWPLRRCSLG